VQVRIDFEYCQPELPYRPTGGTYSVKIEGCQFDEELLKKVQAKAKGGGAKGWSVQFCNTPCSHSLDQLKTWADAVKQRKAEGQC
jgi:hypothetical protein